MVCQEGKIHIKIGVKIKRTARKYLQCTKILKKIGKNYKNKNNNDKRKKEKKECKKRELRRERKGTDAVYKKEKD